jgi:glucan phosphorylase
MRLVEHSIDALNLVKLTLEQMEAEEPDDMVCEVGLLAASLLESFATLETPSWGYSLRPSIVEVPGGL